MLYPTLLFFWTHGDWGGQPFSVHTVHHIDQTSVDQGLLLLWMVFIILKEAA